MGRRVWDISKDGYCTSEMVTIQCESCRSKKLAATEKNVYLFIYFLVYPTFPFESPLHYIAAH